MDACLHRPESSITKRSRMLEIEESIKASEECLQTLINRQNFLHIYFLCALIKRQIFSKYIFYEFDNELRPVACKYRDLSLRALVPYLIASEPGFRTRISRN